KKPESPVLIGERKVIAEDFTYTQQSAVKPTELFSIENEARKTLSQIIGGVVVIIGLLFTSANLAFTHREAEKNRSLALEGQITDRFTKAITQLGDEKLEVRLGGIYALERIAKDSEKDHWTIMEVLTAYVREHTPRKAKDNAVRRLPAILVWNESKGVRVSMSPLGSFKPRIPVQMQNRRTNNAEQKEVTELTTDVQAILTVIGRRMISTERDKGLLNFEETDLSNANLSGANLSGANLSGANLSGADLRVADLRGA